MKKIITFIIVLVFLASLVSAAQGESSGSTTSQVSFGAKIFSIFGIGNSDDSSDTPPSKGDVDTSADENHGVSGDNGNAAGDGTGKVGIGQGIYGAFDWKPSDSVVAVTCFDTDHGRDFSTSGIVTGRIGPDSEVKDYPDRCMPAGNMLVETYCNRWTGYVQYNRITCKNGCTDTPEGAKCSVPPFCLDTDRGANKFIRGSVILFKSASSTIPLGSVAELIADDSIEIIQDFCSSETTIKQFACSGSSVADYTFNELECDENQKCMAGVCKDMVQMAGVAKGESVTTKTGVVSPRDNSIASPESLVGVQGVTGSQDDDSIVIRDGQSETINGVLVSYSNSANTIQFAQQFSEGVHNIEGNEIEIGGETSIDTTIDAPLKTATTLSAGTTSTTSAIEKETTTPATTTPKTTSPTNTLSSRISVSTLKL